jgi:hypothetical protein
MRTFEFDFFSDSFNKDGLCNIIVVTCDLKYDSVLEMDCVEDMQIYDSSENKYRRLEDFPEKERDEIENRVREHLYG